jgi:chaperonin GroES
MPVKRGDHVVFPASAGAWVEVDEERLLVCRVGELLGVLETADDCPQCGGRELGPAESCPVCGREGSVTSS